MKALASESLFFNSIFKLFLKELEALGFTVSDSPRAGSLSYGVVGGRSNARWWLVPLTNRHVATSGLALFQPINPSAKILKRTATVLNIVGLSSLWARNRVYVTCPPVFSELFGDKNLSYAFFTGTDSPHRKTSIQIMDNKGGIKGFAKVSRNASVKPLLKHEAETLNYLNTLDLKTVLIPKVLFRGEFAGAEVLVTDTLKTARTKTSTTLDEVHLAFLRELAKKTTAPETDDDENVVAGLRKQYISVADKLPAEWQQRLEKAIDIVAESDMTLRPGGLKHGDFTPWNIFFVDGRLYVFDWEYASKGCSVGYDLIHFALSLPPVKHQSVSDTIGQVRKVLRESKIAGDDKIADIFFLWYLYDHSLHYIAREAEQVGKVMSWDGALEAAVFFDTLFSR